MTTSSSPDAATARLGDRTVNRIGFGAMRLGLGPDGTPRHFDRSIEVLRKAVELGVNHIDTAAFYRHANESIAAALRPYPEDLVIATKVGPTADLSRQAEPGELREQVERNLQQLGRDQLDLVYLRVGVGRERERGSLGKRFEVLAGLREEGLIRQLGVSNVLAEQLGEAMAIAPVVSVQNRYGIANRDDDPLLAECAAEGIAFVPFFSLVGTNPHGGVRASAAVNEVAGKHGVSPARVLLAWTLRRGPNVLAIPGTGDPAHLEDNMAAVDLRLSEQDVSKLESNSTGSNE